MLSNPPSPTPSSQPVLTCLDKLYILNHPQRFMCPSLLPRGGLACLGQAEGISALSEDKRRIYKTSLYP